MGITNRPTQSSSTNKEKQTLTQIYLHLTNELKKLTPKEDASEDVKAQFKLFTQLIETLKE